LDLEIKMNKVTLNQKQIKELVKIARRFKTIDLFTIEETCTSGIGPNVHVKFKVGTNASTEHDITDVSSW